jgi:TFIIF-interacting CTD phosphatase-like protein
VFTAGTQKYAISVVSRLADRGHVTDILSREHVTTNPVVTKDLSRTGRSLERILLVDNLGDNFILQPSNGILIPTWEGDPSDSALKLLAQLLIELAESRPEDVRPGARRIAQRLLEQGQEGL